MVTGEPGANDRDYLDGARGVLVVTVLLVHIFFVVSYGRGLLPWYRLTFVWFYPAAYLVGIFVVISGYCLMLPVARSGGATIPGGVWGYLQRRALRILPPYYIAAALSVAHVMFLDAHYRQVGLITHLERPGVLWSHLLVVYNASIQWRFEVNSPYWSLAPEWQLYLLFPLVLLPVWRRAGLLLLVLFAVLVTGGLLLIGENVANMHPWFLLLFVCGMGGALITDSANPRMTALRTKVPWGAISALLVGAVAVEWIMKGLLRPESFRTMPPAWAEYGMNECAFGVATLALIVRWTGIQRSLEPARWPALLKFLNRRSVTWLGRFSYSHYLVHFPLLVSLGAILRSLNLPYGVTLALAFLIGVPLSLVVGYLFFWIVERRFLSTHMRVRPALRSSREPV